MPNMVICQPRNGQLLKELLESAFEWKLPTAIRYPNLETEESSAPLQTRPLGKGEILAEGSDLVIVALGHLYKTALELRESLLTRGISAMVVDPIFVKPLDTGLFSNLFCNHNRLVTLEEHSLKGGLGSELNDFLQIHDFRNVETLNFGIPETFVEHGGMKDLLGELGLTQDKMLQKILSHFQL